MGIFLSSHWACTGRLLLHGLFNARDKNPQTNRSIPTQLSDGYLHTHDGHAECIESGIACGSFD